MRDSQEFKGLAIRARPAEVVCRASCMEANFSQEPFFAFEAALWPQGSACDEGDKDAGARAGRGESC